MHLKTNWLNYCKQLFQVELFWKQLGPEVAVDPDQGFLMIRDLDRRRAGTMQIGKDEGILVVGTTGGRVVVSDLDHGTSLCCFKGHRDCVRAVQFDGQKIVSGSRDQTMKIWKKERIWERNEFVVYEEADGVIQFDNNCGAFMFQDNFACAGLSNGDLHFVDLETESIVESVAGHYRWIRHIQVVDNVIATCGADTTVKIWDRRDFKKPVMVLNEHEDCVTALQFDGDRMLTGGYDRCIKEWSLRQGCSIREQKVETAVRSLQYDSSKFMIGCSDSAQMWDLTSMTLIARYSSLKGFISSVRFYEDYLCLSVSDSYLYVIKAPFN